MNILSFLRGIRTTLKTFVVLACYIGWMVATASLDPATLPDDPALLKTLLGEYAQKLGERDRYIAHLEPILKPLLHEKR